MIAVSKMLAGAAGLAAIASAAPAAAQYYPNYGEPNVGRTYGGFGYNGYTSNTQLAVQQCAAAVEQRLNGGYGGYSGASGGGHDAYGNHVGGGYGGGQVVAITHADRHSRGRVKVKGVATSGMNGGYGGYGYGQPAGELRFRCEVDHHGTISDLHIDRSSRAYGNRRY
jgi:hypothetical protein